MQLAKSSVLSDPGTATWREPPRMPWIGLTLRPEGPTRKKPFGGDPRPANGALTGTLRYLPISQLLPSASAGGSFPELARAPSRRANDFRIRRHPVG
jgi:hypothetical protein